MPTRGSASANGRGYDLILGNRDGGVKVATETGLGWTTEAAAFWLPDDGDAPGAGLHNMERPLSEAGTRRPGEKGGRCPFRPCRASAPGPWCDPVIRPFAPSLSRRRLSTISWQI